MKLCSITFMHPIAGMLLIAGLGMTGAAFAQQRCEKIADLKLKSCRAEANEEYWAQRGHCMNEPGPARQCANDAISSRMDAREECVDQHEARGALCADLTYQILPNGAYSPQFGPFIDAAAIPGQPNSYMPLYPGATWIYKDNTGTETITVEVTTATKLIEDVACLVVRDTVTLDFTEDEFSASPVFGAVIEATDDWFAQDEQGNVIYCGEISLEAEPQIGDVPILPSEIISVEGSWKWGRDGAQPGVVMFAAPRIGEVYRSEYLLGEAEDAVEVLDNAYVFGNGSPLDAIIPAQVLSLISLCGAGCVVTLDFTPIDPGAVEYKFFAPGIGMILEVKPDEDEYVELISCSVPGSSCPQASL